MKKCFLYFVLAVMAFTGFRCIKNDTSCPYTELNVKAPDSQVVKLKAYLDSKGINALKDSAGFYYSIITKGSDTVVPKPCSVININYTGRFTTDSIFDRTNGTPVTFRLGDLIAGWQKGLPYIRSGGKMKLYVPPGLGYGSQDVTKPDGAGGYIVIVPKNSILIFDIELLDVR